MPSLLILGVLSLNSVSDCQKRTKVNICCPAPAGQPHSDSSGAVLEGGGGHLPRAGLAYVLEFFHA